MMCRTSSLVVWALYGMPSTRLRHFNFIVWILLGNSAVNVQDWHAYRKMDYIKAYRSFTLVWRVMFSSLRIGLSFLNAAEACAAVARRSAFDPSSLIRAARYLNSCTVSCFFPPSALLGVMNLALFVISLVFSLLISMPYLEADWSRLVTRRTNSSSLPAKPSTSSANHRLAILFPPMLIVLEFSLTSKIYKTNKLFPVPSCFSLWELVSNWLT